MLQSKRKEKYQRIEPQKTALDDLWSAEKGNISPKKYHTSQRPGTSSKIKDSLFEYSSDSTSDEVFKEPMDFDIMHLASPRVSKGVNIKKSKGPHNLSSPQKIQEEYSSDIDTMRGDFVKDATASPTSLLAKNAAYREDNNVMANSDTECAFFTTKFPRNMTIHMVGK